MTDDFAMKLYALAYQGVVPEGLESLPRWPLAFGLSRLDQRPADPLAAAMSSLADRPLLMVEGGAGTGRSRLLQELATRARSEGVDVMTGAGEGGDVPYHLWLGLIKNCLCNGLPAELEGYRDSLSLILPELGPSRRPLDSALIKLHLFEGLTRLLVSQRTGRLTIFLDDIDRADACSLEFLNYLVAQKLPLVVVASHLAGFTWAGARPERLILEPLTREEVVALAESLLGGGALATPSADLLWRDTQGHPLFVVELVKFWVARSLLVWQGAKWVCQSDSSEVPASLAEALERRLADLPWAWRHHLEWLALAERLPFEVWLALTEAEPMELLGEAERLCQAQLLRDDGGWLSFRCPALGRLLLQTLGDTRLKLMHRALAGHQRDPAGRGHHLERAGELSEAAREYLQAAHDYLPKGAYGSALTSLEKAFRLNAELPVQAPMGQALCGLRRFSEALAQYEQALQRADLPQQRVHLMVQLAACHYHAGNLSQSKDWLHQALQTLGVELPSTSWRSWLSTQLEALRQLMGRRRTLALEDWQVKEVEPALRTLIPVLFYERPKHWLLDTLAISQLSQAILKSQPDLASECMTRAAQALVLMAHSKTLPAARQRLKEAVGLLDRLEDSPFKATTQMNVGMLLFESGEVGCCAVVQAAADTARRIGYIVEVPFIYCSLATIDAYYGRFRLADESLQAAATCLELSGSLLESHLYILVRALRYALAEEAARAREWHQRAEPNTGFLQIIHNNVHCWILLAEARWDEALSQSQLELGKDWARDSINRLSILELRTISIQARAEMLLAQASPPLAQVRILRKELHKLRRLSQGIFLVFECLSHRLEARLLQSAGQLEGARKSWREALRLAERGHIVLETAHALLGLAELAGPTTEAEEMRRRAAEIRYQSGALTAHPKSSSNSG